MEDFTLEKMVEIGLLPHATAIADIGDRSGKERLRYVIGVV